MNIIKRDGKTFVEVEILQGEYCGDCIFYGDIKCLLLQKYLKSEVKHKDCPSLKE